MSSLSDLDGTPAPARTGWRFSEDRSAETVCGSFAAAPPRLRQILESLVRHLHGFAKEVRLSQAELDLGIDFLTRTGQMCDGVRQEFILLSDVLGLSMLVDSMSNRLPGDLTASTVLGPFHMVESPPRPLGADISLAAGGEPTIVTGRVLSSDGTPLPLAQIDTWQADDQGYYDVQRPGQVPEGNLRGLFTCDESGQFRFRAILPAPYPIPDDGPVGQLLAATGRHPYRPAHIHFIVQAPGHQSLTTHIFVAGSPYLDSDAVFGVKDSLIVDFPVVEDEGLAEAFGLPARFRHAHVEIRLRPQDEA